jgi:hypothetical protein
MNKLRLRLDDLQVDTFQTTPAQKEKGTVFGEQCTCYSECTCPGCPTCDASCNGTCEADTGCGPTCNASCRASCVDNTCAIDYGSCGLSCPNTCYETCICAGGGPRTYYC